VRVGIVAEGPADIAVVRNILKGKLGLDAADTEPLRPKLALDETDLAAARKTGGYHAPTPEEYSNWMIVLEECSQRTTIEDFLENQLDEERLVVIHIDTAEAHLPGYDIARPDRKAPGYSDGLRSLVVQKLWALLGADLAQSVRFAIAIEETEAWLLTLDDSLGDRDTGARRDPKKWVEDEARKQRQKGKARAKKPRDDEGGRKKKSPYAVAHELSLAFRDSGQLEVCAGRNRSLRLFLDSLTPPPDP